MKTLKPTEYPRESIAAQLFARPFEFHFFQAMRLLEKLFPERRTVGYPVPPNEEIVRLRAHASLAFPPSQIDDLVFQDGQPVMTVTFLGLTGPSGVMPRHYTEQLMRLHREVKGAERTALRDWFDLFNHRLISLFHRAWQKYRFWTFHERGEHLKDDIDLFTFGLMGLVGRATPGQRGRTRVSFWDVRRPTPETPLAQLHDLTFLYYSGLFSRRVRTSSALEAIVRDYFGQQTKVLQFQGQWLQLTPDNQSRLGGSFANNQLGMDTVAGERVWDVQGKFRVRIGPLTRRDFYSFLPDRTPSPQRKAFFLLLHLVRSYVGPELTFDVQVVLKASDVPECSLENDAEPGPRLGWNTWLVSQPSQDDVSDAVFEGEEIVWINPEDIPETVM